MRRIRWSKPAEADFRRLFRYLSRDNPDAADRVGGAIIAKAGRLAEFPLVGAPRPDGRSRKSLVIGTRYLLIYRVDRDGITLLRIYHESQNRR